MKLEIPGRMMERHHSAKPSMGMAMLQNISAARNNNQRSPSWFDSSKTTEKDIPRSYSCDESPHSVDLADFPSKDLKSGKGENSEGNETKSVRGRRQSLPKNYINATLEPLPLKLVIPGIGGQPRRPSFMAPASMLSQEESAFDDSHPSRAHSICVSKEEESKQTKSSNVSKRYITLSAWFIFILALGFTIGLVSVNFHLCIATIEHNYPPHDMETSLYILLRAIGVFISAGICSWIGATRVPEVSGGGILPVMICLAMGAPIPVRIGFIRFAVSTIYLGFGNPLGAETPTLHIASAVACGMYEVANKILGDKHFPKNTQSAMVIMGCVAGVSAAFNSALGGILYGIEHFSHTSDVGLLPRLMNFFIALACGISCFTARSFNLLPVYHAIELDVSLQKSIKEVTPTAVGDLLGLCLLSLCFGAVFGFIGHLFLVLTKESRKIILDRIDSAYAGLVSAFVTSVFASICFYFTHYYGIWGVGWTTLEKYLKQDEMGLTNQVTFFVSKFIITSIAVATGGAGGIFGPALVLGAAAGGTLSSILPFGEETFEYKILPVLGMSCMFSAIHRLPITAIYISYEMADLGDTRYDAVFVMIISTFVSEFVAAELSELNIFSVIILQDGIDPAVLSHGISVMEDDDDPSSADHTPQSPLRAVQRVQSNGSAGRQSEKVEQTLSQRSDRSRFTRGPVCYSTNVFGSNHTNFGSNRNQALNMLSVVLDREDVKELSKSFDSNGSLDKALEKEKKLALDSLKEDDMEKGKRGGKESDLTPADLSIQSPNINVVPIPNVTENTLDEDEAEQLPSEQQLDRKKNPTLT